MEKKQIENKAFFKVGNTQFNKEAVKGMKKEDFVSAYKGKINVDLDQAWKEFDKKRKAK